MTPEQIFEMKRQLAQRMAMQRLMGGGAPGMGQAPPQQMMQGMAPPQQQQMAQPQIDPNILLQLFRQYGGGGQQQGPVM